MKQILFVLCATIVITSCNNSGGWSAAEKQQSSKACMDQVNGKVDDATAKKYCSCVVEKMMQKYPTYAEANKNGTEEDGIKIGQACAAELKLNGGNNNNNNNNGINGGLGGGLENGGGGGLSSADEQKFMNTCLQNARNAGGDEQTANTHCNCTLKKIEKKYSSYDEANRKMTKEEMNTIEQECVQERTNNNDN